MFETLHAAIPDTTTRRNFLSTFLISLMLHVTVTLACVALWTCAVSFPTTAPRMIAAYTLVALPVPALAAGSGRKAPAPRSGPPQRPAPLDEDISPQRIPDAIPVLGKPFPAGAGLAESTAASFGSGSGPAGGIDGGMASSLVQEPPQASIESKVDDGRVHIPRGAGLPMTPIDQDWPDYPPGMARKGIEDNVLVRYVVGKDGRVIEIVILAHALVPIFDEATLKAIRLWRFRPLTRHGEPVEVVHELLVQFRLMRDG